MALGLGTALGLRKSGVGSGGAAALSVTSATLSTSGSDTLLTLVFSEAVVGGSGGFYGWTLNPSGGAAGVTYSSGYGTDTWVFLTQRPIASGETATLAYTQPGNGIEASSGGTDLASFSGQAVTNNSTYSALLVFDQFTTADAAPLTTPRTCEPGPGTLTALETPPGAALAIASGVITAAKPSSAPSFSGYGFHAAPAITRNPGIVIYGKTRWSGFVDACAAPWFHTAAALATPSGTGLRFTSAAVLTVHDLSSSFTVGESLPNTTDYHTALVLRGTGAFYFIRGGVPFPSWNLVWVGHIQNALTHYGVWNNSNTAVTGVDDFTIKQLTASVFTDEVGIAQGWSPVVASGDTATVDADGMQTILWVPTAGEILDIQLRRTDDNNCWIIRCEQGANIKLFKKEAGTETEVDTGKTQTWTVGSPYIITGQYIGANLRSYVTLGGAAPTVTIKHNYATATFQQTATGAKIAGTAAGLANWARYPRTFSGSALDDLAPTGTTVSLAANPNRVVWVTDPHVKGNGVAGLGSMDTYRAQAMTLHINSLRPVLSLWTGDLGESQGDDSTLARDYLLHKLRHPFRVGRGNHDADTEAGSVPGPETYVKFDTVFPAAVYPYHWTVDWAAANVRFIFIHSDNIHTGETNSGNARITQAEVDWLEDQLDGLSGGYKAIVLSHFPSDIFFGGYIHADEGGTALLAVLDEHAASIAFCGHGHRHISPATNTRNGMLHVNGACAAYMAGAGAFGFMVMDYDSGANTITIQMRTARDQFGQLARSVWTPLVIAL